MMARALSTHWPWHMAARHHCPSGWAGKHNSNCSNSTMSRFIQGAIVNVTPLYASAAQPASSVCYTNPASVNEAIQAASNASCQHQLFPLHCSPLGHPLQTPSSLPA
jgi:hypothetical protein